MLDPKQERELRRAVVQLDRCGIEDIEWIWSTLSDDQRRRLKPLLAAAGTRWKALLDDASVAPLPDAAEADQQRMAALIERLPIEIGKRVLACMGDTQRHAMVERLSPAKSIAAKLPDASRWMTERTQRSLQVAASACAKSMPLLHQRKKSAWPRFMQWMARR
ncbi:hypothetical protein [Dyella acidisoli]|uniref:Magnesium transporter MgtE intracellular domain-containing protein n=1 Tax=Dyella acidisoli TaxID=1867834 RepID=A0ABQ5XN53_9GAMM|nr:hypothetical protein [Dyella acidisoli]GLQ92641.1 hypothetical protein GCM10007901_15920 [Dyella acidisoli]